MELDPGRIALLIVLVLLPIADAIGVLHLRARRSRLRQGCRNLRPPGFAPRTFRQPPHATPRAGPSPSAGDLAHGMQHRGVVAGEMRADAGQGLARHLARQNMAIWRGRATSRLRFMLRMSSRLRP